MITWLAVERKLNRRRRMMAADCHSLIRKILWRTAVAFAPGSVVILLGVALAACDNSAPAAPSPPAAREPRLTLLADHVVTMSPGESLTLKVEEKDSEGRVVAGLPEAYAWTSTAPGVVDVAAGGVLIAGPELGYSQVIVRTATGQAPAGPDGPRLSCRVVRGGLSRPDRRLHRR